ncbi:MAG: carboxypeptidase-like regulatory domain-containing protein, partial [Muribaculaceae bacterium]|nr:carboxypeptidase-like regulatory domain-containing protein [Muribaculaceae bacterium]
MIAAGVLEASGAVDVPTYIRGIVRDAETLQGLPYASVSAYPSGASTVADSRGIFEFNVPAGTDSLTAACQGYAPRTEPVRMTWHNLYDIA